MLLLDPGPVTFAERVRPGSQGVDGRSSNGPGPGRNTPFTPAMHACYPLGYWPRSGSIETMLSPQESSVVLRTYGLPAGTSDVSSADLNRLLKCVARQLT
jgi:hypothetical protein